MGSVKFKILLAAVVALLVAPNIDLSILGLNTETIDGVTYTYKDIRLPVPTKPTLIADPRTDAVRDVTFVAQLLGGLTPAGSITKVAISIGARSVRAALVEPVPYNSPEFDGTTQIWPECGCGFRWNGDDTVRLFLATG